MHALEFSLNSLVTRICFAASLLTLQGAGAYDAAVHCASVSAAKRMSQSGPNTPVHSPSSRHSCSPPPRHRPSYAPSAPSILSRQPFSNIPGYNMTLPSSSYRWLALAFAVVWCLDYAKSIDNTIDRSDLEQFLWSRCRSMFHNWKEKWIWSLTEDSRLSKRLSINNSSRQPSQFVASPLLSCSSIFCFGALCKTLIDCKPNNGITFEKFGLKRLLRASFLNGKSIVHWKSIMHQGVSHQFRLILYCCPLHPSLNQ